MASHKLGLFLCILVHGLLLSSLLVHCEESAETLFSAMNSYRISLNLSTLSRNPRAECLAKQVAWDFNDEAPFSLSASGSTITPGNLTQLPDFLDYLSKCGIDLNHTKNGVILPLNTPKLALNLVLTNCTRSQMAKYLSKREYSSVGIGHYEDWAVFALGTSSPAGSFSSSATLSALCNRRIALLSSLLLWLLLNYGEALNF